MENQFNQNPDKRQTIFGLEKKRGQVIEMLNEALTNNDLDITTYEQRFDIAQNAQSVEELENAIYDFPNAHLIFPHLIPKYPQKPIVYTSQSSQILTENGKKSNFINLLGSKHITVHELRSAGFVTSTGLGETVIDLREMARYCNEITIQNYNFMGSVKVKVSTNTLIRKQFVNILGETSERVRSKDNPNIFTKLFRPKHQLPMANHHEPMMFVNIIGINLLGEISIEYETPPISGDNHQYQS